MSTIEYFGFFSLSIAACIGILTLTWWLMQD